jgi:predicted TPR repeat methyltransferase
MTTPLFVSSGDLLADRRYQWAIDLAARGDLAGAADLLLQVVELAPAFATAWFALGAIRDRQGDREGAIAAFRRAHAVDREDYHGARLHLARLGAEDGSPEASPAYIRRLFDQQASDFDASLIERLHYRGPQLLLDALGSVCRITDRHMRFGTVLDLGCGTGLAGAALRPYSEWLCGIDLSPGMLEQARAKGLYDKLEVTDVREYLAEQKRASAFFHLVVAADVFVYFADLKSPIADVADVLSADGIFAFTVEAASDENVFLQDTLRYAHGEKYVRAALGAADLTVPYLHRATLRTEKGLPVEGLVVVAKTS